jgi:hypothetical protein
MARRMSPYWTPEVRSRGALAHRVEFSNQDHSR